MKVFQYMARELQRMATLSAMGNGPMSREVARDLQAFVKKMFPSGSGFDAGTELHSDSTSEKIILQTSFHHMDDNGSYCGWSEHMVIVTASLAFGFHLRVTGKNVRDIKDYIAEMFDHYLNEEKE